MKRTLTTSLAFVTLSVMPTPTQAASTYTCVTFNATQLPGAQSIYPTGINNSGAVVGTYSTTTNSVTRYAGIKSFLRQPDGTFAVIQYPGAITTWAFSLNNSGQVAGTYQISNNDKFGFIRSANGTYTSLSLPAAPAGQTWDPTRFWVYGINDSGELSGVTFASNSSYGYVWHFIRSAGGAYQFFDPLDGGSDTSTDLTYFPFLSGPITNDGAILENFSLAGSFNATNQVRNPDGTLFSIPYPVTFEGSSELVVSGLSSNGSLFAGSFGDPLVFTSGITGPAVPDPTTGSPAVACPPDSSDNAVIQLFAVNDAGVVSGSISSLFLSPGGLIATPTGKTSALTLSNTSWQFAAHPVGQKSGPGNIFLTSNGAADLNIQGIAISPDPGSVDPSDFNVTSTNCLTPQSQAQYLPKTIPVGQFCQITFNFTPLLAGERKAAIVIVDDTPQSPHVIPVQGTGLGPAVQLSNREWNFNPYVNPPVAGTVYVYNPGTEPAQISGIDLSGPTPNYFSYGTTCGATLAPQATCNVQFDLIPGVSPGMADAVLSFTDNAVDSPQTLRLGNNP